MPSLPKRRLGRNAKWSPSWLKSHNHSNCFYWTSSTAHKTTAPVTKLSSAPPSPTPWKNSHTNLNKRARKSNANPPYQCIGHNAWRVKNWIWILFLLPCSWWGLSTLFKVNYHRPYVCTLRVCTTARGLVTSVRIFNILKLGTWGKNYMSPDVYMCTNTQ